MSKVHMWELYNRNELNNMFEIILNSLEKKNIFVINNQVFYNEFVKFFVKNLNDYKNL